MSMEGYTQYNILDATFDDFIGFLFDHDVIPDPDDPENDPVPWYWEAEVVFIPINVANYYVELFTEPEFLLARYSSEKLEQGFWAIQSGNIECAVSEIIWLTDVPEKLRENCVRSMYHLFEKLFSVNPLDTSSNMWWDAIAYEWHCDNRNRNNGGEDLWMQDVMFETLKQILSLPNLDCQISALHGLGHLHHPDTKKIIDKYLKENSGLKDDVRKYALAASIFDIM